MKPVLLFLSYLLPLSVVSQETLEGQWHTKCGISRADSASGFSIFNIRYVSPRFHMSNEDRDWTDEERQHKNFNNGRLMLELLYSPPLKFLGAGINVQCRLLKFKKLNLEGYGGAKFIFISPADYVINPYVSDSGNNAWYINFGLICQLDFGVVGPYADIGTDGIITLGSEFDFHTIVKKIRKKYRPPYLQS